MLSINILDRKKFDLKNGKPYNLSNIPFNEEEYIKFESKDVALEWAKRNYKKWSEEYDFLFGETGMYDGLRKFMMCSESADPLRFYCGHVARNLNGYLRGTRKTQLDYSGLNDALVMLLLNAPRISENIVIYRYVPDKVIEDILKENKNKKIYVDEGFLSCSLLKKPDRCDDFDYNNILEIYVDKGTVGVYTGLISNNNKWEYEILILRKARMYLLDYPIKDRENNKKIYKVRLHNIVNHEDSL